MPKNDKAQYKAMMHSNPAIQRAKAKIRGSLGLSVSSRDGEGNNRGFLRQQTHRHYQDSGNAVEVLEQCKLDWWKGKRGGPLVCSNHQGDFFNFQRQWPLTGLEQAMKPRRRWRLASSSTGATRSAQ